MTTLLTPLQMSPVCFILCKQTNLIEEIGTVVDSDFHGVSQFRDRAVCCLYSFARISP